MSQILVSIPIFLLIGLTTVTSVPVCERGGDVGPKTFEFQPFEHPTEANKSACYFILDSSVEKMVNRPEKENASYKSKDIGDHPNYFRIDVARNECMRYNATLPIVIWKENAQFLEMFSKKQPFALGWKHFPPDKNGMFWVTGRPEAASGADYEPAYWNRMFDRRVKLVDHFTYAQYDSSIGEWVWIDAVTDDIVPHLMVICEQQSIGFELALRGPTSEYDEDGGTRAAMWAGSIIGTVSLIFARYMIN